MFLVSTVLQMSNIKFSLDLHTHCHSTTDNKAMMFRATKIYARQNCVLLVQIKFEVCRST